MCTRGVAGARSSPRTRRATCSTTSSTVTRSSTGCEPTVSATRIGCSTETISQPCPARSARWCGNCRNANWAESSRRGKSWCRRWTPRAAGAATHLDGARLWEAAAGYRRTVAEISALFDTVYVSLYKSLEAPWGAVIAGDRDVIRDVWTWAVRLGGDSAGNWPLAAFGLMALDELLPRMPRYLDHARAIADAIDAIVAVVLPAVPETGIVHVHLPFAAERVAAAHEIIAREHGIWLSRAPA
ncbi:beta-eliminating lyase-related protein [Sphaerisporangium sp. NPDC051011]|uniref:beta-eliminating lyase-related protein n=1 Tax=Sphaerisporangium sp. NPDC051011 TaxID=3155792 RepID=UPI00340D3BEF